LVFLNVVYSTKNLSIQDRAVHMKEEKKERSDSILSLSRGGKRNRVLWREGEHSGAFIKMLHCIQDHKWNAKQGWEGCELRNKSEAIPLLTSLYKALLVLVLVRLKWL
jgi:hypothetical protein